MKLVPQGGVITLIRGVPDEMGKEQGLGEILLPRAQRQGGENAGEMEIKGEATQTVFLELLGGSLSRLVSEDKCRCLDVRKTLSAGN